LTVSLLPKNHMLFIVSKQCACSRRVRMSTLFLYDNYIKGILSTSCVIFSYPKLLLISVLTFIKWRLTPSYVAKDTIFWQKKTKTIIIRIIVWTIGRKL
jgi:hypothetical protein